MSAPEVSEKEGSLDQKMLASQERTLEKVLTSSSPQQNPSLDEARGGIDLNAIMETLQIEGDAGDFKLDPALIEQIPIDGFSPVIIQITPVTNIPLILGVQDPREIPEVQEEPQLTWK